MYMKNKVSKITVVFYWILTVIVTLVAIREQWDLITLGEVQYEPSDSIAIFIMIQKGVSSTWLCFLYGYASLVVVPLLYSHEEIAARISHFDFQIKQRMKKNNRLIPPYFLNVLFKNAIITFGVYFIGYIIQALLIAVLYLPIMSEQSPHLTWSGVGSFSTNAVVELVAYSIFSSLGYAVISNLIFTLGLYIKKYSIYLGTGLITITMCIIIPALLPIQNEIIQRTLFAASMVQPGMYTLRGHMSEHNPIIFCITTMLLYSIITVLLLLVRLKLDRREGY